MLFRLLLPIAVLATTPFILVALWNGGDYRMLLTIFLALQAFECAHDVILYFRGQKREEVVVDVVEAE